MSQQAADNLINVEESIKYINFLNNDIEKAYCMLGNHDLVECDLTTDTYKRIYTASSELEELFCNVFENKDGEAFFAHNRPGQADLVELKKISGHPIGLVETENAGQLRSVNTFKNMVIGVSDEKHLAIFLENGLRAWNEKSAAGNTVQGMMQEEVDEDESDITPGSRGMKSKMHSKK